MNTRFFTRTRILFCATMFTFITFAAIPKSRAQGGAAAPSRTDVAKRAAQGATKNTNHGGLTPDTLLVKLQADPSQPPIELTLKQFMQKYNIPGLNVAVIDNYKIAWAGAFGVTAPGGTEPVTTSTLFQAGSISKPVAAVVGVEDLAADKSGWAWINRGTESPRFPCSSALRMGRLES
ncbi:MAG TPA: serine hydrolase domain-containing protein [Candidatus Angelobacter sp.]|jgi:CubicO group peptidase (beta-lactamase class C family)